MSVIGKIMRLDEKFASIEVEHLALRENVPVTPDTSGFAELFAGEVGSRAMVEVEVFPAGRTSTKDNLVIKEILGIYYPPIQFEWEGTTYEIPRAVADAQGPVVIVLDRGTAVQVSWWKETDPPQPGDIQEMQVTAAGSKEILARRLDGKHSHVVIAEWVPDPRPVTFHP